ncbi:MAG: hypothetical protein Fur0022_44710 [Anaerolineales bacterium]
MNRAQWVELASEANRFDLMPLVYFRLGRSQANLIPDYLCQEFEKKWFISTSANLLVHRQLQIVLRELIEVGIQVIVLKGAYLAYKVYRDPALRLMGDVDILVRREQLAKTVEVLDRLGYQTAKPFWIEDECAVRHHLPAFTQPGQPIIEVHWSLIAPTNKVKIDLDGLWKRAMPLQIAGIPVFGLSPVDLVAHLSLHACRDRFVFGLRALSDIQETLTFFENSFDWSSLRQRAEEWQIERCIFLTLFLAARHLGVKVPEWFLNALRPVDFAPNVSTWAMEQVFEGRIIGMPPAITQFQGRKSFGAKVTALVRGFFPAPAMIRKKYALPPHSWKVYLFYIYHGIDLLRLHGWSAVQLWRGNPGVLQPVQRMTALGEWLFP